MSSISLKFDNVPSSVSPSIGYSFGKTEEPSGEASKELKERLAISQYSSFEETMVPNECITRYPNCEASIWPSVETKSAEIVHAPVTNLSLMAANRAEARIRMRSYREEQTFSDADARREQNTIARALARKNIPTEQQADDIRAVNRDANMRRRDEMTSAETDEIRRADREARATSRNTFSIETATVNHNCARLNVENVVEPNSVGLHCCGSLTFSCVFCKARFWQLEINSKKKYQMCCMQGKIKLSAIQTPPPLLKSLFENDPSDKSAKIFNQKPRLFNSTLSFASVSLNQYDFKNAAGVPALRISGNIYHNLGPFQPRSNTSEPKFLQLFFYEHLPEILEERKGLSQDEMDIMDRIFRELKAHNSFLASVKSTIERRRKDIIDKYGCIMANAPEFRIIINDVAPAGAAPRTYNRPTCTEVSAIVIDNDPGVTQEPSSREVVIESRGGQIKRINVTHTSYDPMAYVLTHAHGDCGWTYKSIQYAIQTGQKREYVTSMEYYSYRIQVRDASTENVIQDVLLFGGLLFQQYLCDMWVKIEQDRLQYVFHNQKQFKAECYKGLVDAVAANEHHSAGSYVVLPSSFIGSPRHQSASFQDAMAIARKYGKADLFLTMTCNPNWTEIKEAIGRQEPWQRPDIVCRVFNMKFKELLNDVTKSNVLGNVIAYLYVIEFQKRGLPHCHMLLFVDNEDKLRTPDQCDSLVSAEIPDPIAQPRLYETVTTHMIHGPCGVLNPKSICMDKNGSCTKHFPKEICQDTDNKDASYPIYRRRSDTSGGRSFQNRTGNVIDNSWVVPYNPWLLHKYNCHLNLEVCSTISSIKYLFKYIYKGDDRVTMKLQATDGSTTENHMSHCVSAPTCGPVIDEVEQYVHGRYIGGCNAAWRIFGYTMQGSYPNVTRLPIHLPDQQSILYKEGAEEAALIAAAQEKTMLTGYFAQVQFEHSHPLADDVLGYETIHGQRITLPSATALTFQEFPTYYTWNGEKHTTKWTRRIKPKKSTTIGRMFAAHPNSGDRFYLRMLLATVAGARSFEDLRTVDGILCENFHDACKALGFLQDDEEWIQFLHEIASFSMPYQIRESFLYILLNNAPTDPVALWEIFKDDLSEDFQHRREQKALQDNKKFVCDKKCLAEDHNACLKELNTTMLSMTDNMKSLWSMTISNSKTIDFGFQWTQLISEDNDASNAIYESEEQHQNVNRLIKEELEYDISQQLLLYHSNYSKCNQDQKRAIDTIMIGKKKVFFLDAPGGTGKTFVFNTLLAKFRSERKIAIAVASSGISATLLAGGRTAHSRFKLTLQPLPNYGLSIGGNTNLADLLRQSDIIIWDEIAMMHRYHIEALDRTMKSLMRKQDESFGGKKVVFGGDFRQVLPVIPRAGRATIVSMTVKFSSIWNDVQTLQLTINERVNNTRVQTHEEKKEAGEFADWLLAIGESRVRTEKSIGIYNNTEAKTIKISKKHMFEASPNFAMTQEMHLHYML